MSDLQAVTVEDDLVMLFLADRTELCVAAAWLRDSCRCRHCVHEASGQRLTDPAVMLADVTISSATMRDGSLEIVWAADDHRSEYTLEQLMPEPRGRAVELWDASFVDRLPRADFAAVSSDRAVLAAWLDAVDRFGVAVLHAVPTAPGTVTAVAELFGFVRETNYGRLFDVVSTPDPINLAYSGLGLAVHTDNPYRDPVPTLQLLHCLSSSTSGGDNTLVDGFSVAEHLREHHPDDFGMLATLAVPFCYADDTCDLAVQAPIIDLDAAGEVRGIRFNPRAIRPPAIAATDAGAARQTVRWYAAYRRFAELCADARFVVPLRLEAGDLFIVDNRRVLHGRTAFDGTGGRRHLQGCYADIDGLRSTLAVLRRDRADDVVDAVLHVLETAGRAQYLGEPVSMLAHMVQTAHQAELAGGDQFAVAAALLHDIGHLVHELPVSAALDGIDTRHEEAGADWLRPHFVDEVTSAVRLHVAAKRYLCAVEPEYLHTLSPASVHSLHLQGGPMTPDEATSFAALPGAALAVAVRRWDDMGKAPGVAVPPLAHYRDALLAARR
jgi:gamma-butyrobetaine dioxygenase